MIKYSAPIQTFLKGSILVVNEPCATESQKVTSNDTSNCDKPKHTRDGLKSILFMDDENTLRLVVQLMLERLGYQVTTSKHGQQTLEFYQTQSQIGHPFDAVILDINIEHGMGGIETLKKLLQIDPDIKAIGASGSVTPETLKSLLKIGFSCVLAKPFRLDQLKNAIELVLG